MALGARWIASAILLVACVGFGVGDRALANEAGAKANVIAFGFYGDQDVFQSEAQRAAAIVAAKYGRGGMVIVRANIGARRAAMIADLRSAVAEVAARADGGDDVLFLILSSHGSRAGIAVKSGAVTETLSPGEVGAMLDGAGIGRRVIIVSACYSGVFARALADSRTVVITASDADHASFGCRGGNAWTDFGRAFFAQALPRASGLSEAFATARSLIERQEAASNETRSNPQMAGGEAVLARLDRAAPSNPSEDVASDAPFAAPATGCVLKAEPSPTASACKVFNGYSGGRLVGAFHLSGPRTVAAGAGCPSDYPPGRQLAANKIAVEGTVYTLTPDCRGSAKSSQ
jgi:hypothetical protein